MPGTQRESLEMRRVRVQDSSLCQDQSAGHSTNQSRSSHESVRTVSSHVLQASTNERTNSNSTVNLGGPNSMYSASFLDANPVKQNGAESKPSNCREWTAIEPLLPEPDVPRVEPTQCRKKSDLTAIGQAVLDMCITATSLYFLAFAIAASIHDGDPATSSLAKSLLQASRLGPTILPTMFAAIVGRFLTSFTAWRLERKIELATVECIMGSRTVFGVISTPFRSRTLHVFTPFLLILWALSPLGGQASLRAISSGPRRTNDTVGVSYLNTSSGWSVQGVSGMASFRAAINAPFIGALAGSAASKRAPQDAYQNLKVPFLETLAAQSNVDAEGWHAIHSPDQEYSSLVGLPIKGINNEGLTFIRLESSYLFPTCSLSLVSIEDESAWRGFNDENCTAQTLVLQLRNVSYVDWSSSPSLGTVLMSSVGDSDNGAIVTTATCNLTTTHVETSYTCERQNCTPIAIRESRHTRDYPAASQQLDVITGPGSWSPNFCSMFVNAAGQNHYGALSPLELYILDPDVPFRYVRSGERPILADVGEDLFALRFAQLLNSYWTVGIAPYAVPGGLNVSVNSTNASPGSGYAVSSTEAQLQTTETVLICSRPWLAVLIISSLAMSAAGVATTIFNLLRRGPEILDSFTSYLRDSPFIHRDTGPSTEDGPEKARRLGSLKVMLGDVRPEEENGYIAIAAASKDCSVERLRPIRRYG